MEMTDLYTSFRNKLTNKIPSMLSIIFVPLNNISNHVFVYQ